MAKNNNTNKDQLLFQSQGLYKVISYKENEIIKTEIKSNQDKSIAFIYENPRDQENHFDLNSSFILDDATEIYFHKSKKSSSELNDGIYIISNEIISYSPFDLGNDYKEIKLSSTEFDTLYLKAQENSKQYYFDDETWTLIKTEENLANIAYESFGNFSVCGAVEVVETKPPEAIGEISFEDKIETLDEDTLEIYLKLDKLKANNEQKALFFEYYFEEGVDEIVLKIFISLIEKNAEKEVFDKLDEYIREHHCISESKTAKEEETKIFKFMGLKFD